MGTPRDGKHQITDHTRIQEMESWETDVGTGRREGAGGEIGEGRGRDWTPGVSKESEEDKIC